MRYNVGDKAVYPGHGVGEIKGIEHQEIMGQRLSFLVLELLNRKDGDPKKKPEIILIPINKVNSVGLRDVIDEKEAKKVYRILRKKDVSVDATTWNRRYREYTEKVKTGSVFEIAEVLRDLYLLKFDKDLSFGERKMFDQARALLIKELAIAKNCDEEQIEKDFQRIFAKAS
jgi:CarD family transcriptional regulator